MRVLILGTPRSGSTSLVRLIDSHMNLFNYRMFIEPFNQLLDKEINKFKNMPYGIISCIYIFGEGFDMPKLNGVCIASNMKSIIRIVQYLLRPNRLESGNPLKKAYQIIPYIDNDLSLIHI